MNENLTYWYNYTTGEYEERATPEDFTNYIPQIPAAQSLYKLFQKIGKTPLEAAVEVLRACVPASANE